MTNKTLTKKHANQQPTEGQTNVKWCHKPTRMELTFVELEGSG